MCRFPDLVSQVMVSGFASYGFGLIRFIGLWDLVFQVTGLVDLVFRVMDLVKQVHQVILVSANG